MPRSADGPHADRLVQRLRARCHPGETLLLANVTLAGTTHGATTNGAGTYVLPNLEPGTQTVIVTYVGYRTLQQEIAPTAGEAQRRSFELIPEDLEMNEVVVEAEEETQALGVSKLSTQAVQQLPTAFEPDVFCALQLLPGVKAASNFSSGLYIRGGGPDQTLILLDRSSCWIKRPSTTRRTSSAFSPPSTWTPSKTYASTRVPIRPSTAGGSAPWWTFTTKAATAASTKEN